MGEQPQSGGPIGIEDFIITADYHGTTSIECPLPDCYWIEDFGFYALPIQGNTFGELRTAARHHLEPLTTSSSTRLPKPRSTH